VAEGRLDEFSLCLPEFAFAGEQAIAEDGAEGAVVARLEEICLVLDEDFFDAVGMYDEAYGDVEEAEEDDIAVFAGAAREETAPVLAEGQRMAQKIQAARAGRKSSSGVCCDLGLGHRANIIRCGSFGAGMIRPGSASGIANTGEPA